MQITIPPSLSRSLPRRKLLFFRPPTHRSPEEEEGKRKKGGKTRSRVKEKKRGISGEKETTKRRGKEWKRGKKEKNEERWIGRGRVKRTRRAKTEYLIYEYVWGASSQLEKLTATNGRACRSPWSARCPNLESK